MPRTLWSMIGMKGINMCDYVDVSGDTMGTVRILLEYRITVLGGFSGRGKSRFVSETAIQVYRTEDDLRQYTFVTESSLPKRTFPDGSDPKVFRDTLRNGESFVLIADEEFVLECLPDVLLSRHKVLVIARSRRLYNFVEYTSFEALLYFSKLVQSIPASDIAHDTREKSIELYYEKLLYNVTRGTKSESSHPNFSECFIKNCSCCCEFSQPSLLFGEEGLQFLKWYWNTYHPEWVPLTDAVISVLKASYSPKGF